MEKARALLKKIRGKTLDKAGRISHALELADLLLRATLKETTGREKRRENRVAKLMADAPGKAFLTAATDQSFRTNDAKRIADQLLSLLKRVGLPRFLESFDRFKILLFEVMGRKFPHFFVSQLKKGLRNEIAPFLLPQDREEKRRYLEQCRRKNIRVNYNYLGEAILGEKEAKKRLQIYLKALEEVDYISVKISTLYSQLNVLDFDRTIEKLAEPLRILYRAAMAKKAFVNLDMEEYKDLDLTVALFQKVLGEPEFLTFSAGIVLQSYLPDSFQKQHELTSFAVARAKLGGAPLKLRVVKGANLAMERVEGSLRLLPAAPFETKVETDAQFLKMLDFAMTREHASSLNIGVGSHNLLDIAYALVLAEEREVSTCITIEMLKGMAEPMQRTIHALTGSLLLYCPEARESDFQNAVAYLIRRLDENTGKENFLHHLFALSPESAAWEQERNRFLASCNLLPSSESRRVQDRLHDHYTTDLSLSFVNEPDTDFSQMHNRIWASDLIKSWKGREHGDIPIVLCGKEIFSNAASGIDPSNPVKPLYKYAQADTSMVDEALSFAANHPPTWNNRSETLAHVAKTLRSRRFDLIGAMIADAGKTFVEADTEVSEAIDFVEYYRKIWEKITSDKTVKWSPKGTVLIAPPWNFPCSIPTSGIAAALVTGNAVIFKPAPEAVLVGWHLVQAFYEGGVPKEILQFLCCPDDPVGSALVRDQRVNAVFLTGATTTARHLMSLRSDLDLSAETGGKNTLIVSNLSDRDLAIRDILQSAFGHAGQKCSALSLLILHKEFYDDPLFLQALEDAASSLTVGSAWDLATRVPPLIRPPEKALLRALTTLEEGESWLLTPTPHPENPHLWSPGIKLGVRHGSFTHQTEFFGPLLGIMRAEDLDQAITMANGTPYGLTAGLHSLDEREHALWREKMRAGNLYINRSITGAIVRRQPFGGCKASQFGRGAKAGGPNYLLAFATPHEEENPSGTNYAYWSEILKEKSDPSQVIGEENLFYHLPLDFLVLRIQENDRPTDLSRAIVALIESGTPFELSLPSKQFAFEHLHPIYETESGFLARCKKENWQRIRLLSHPSTDLLKLAASRGIFLDSDPVLSHGRFEMLHYLREVSYTYSYHRYGNLGFREF